MVSLLFTLVVAWPATAQDVRTDRSGLGVVLGWRFGARYQRALNWRQAAFFDLGYQTDEFIVADANFSHYFLSEEDRWRNKGGTGTVLYNIFVGVTVGYHVGTDRDERSRLGARGGGAFEYLFPASDWSIRAEVAPVLFFSGTTAAGFQGGVVLLRYFGKSVQIQKAKPKRHVR